MPDLGIPLLLDYLYWLRDRVFRVAAELDTSAFRDTPSLRRRDLRATLAHELDVEHSWRPKLQGEPMDSWGPRAEVRADEFPTLDTLMARWRFDEAEVRDWIGGLDADDLARPVKVNGLGGYSLEMYLLHVIQHGVTEFTMAAAILAEVGLEAGELGIVDFLEETAPNPRPGT